MTVVPDDPSSMAGSALPCRAACSLIIAAAAALSLADLLAVDSPMQSANDRSRWCTVWSLVHRGTYVIDEIIAVPGWDTIDKVRLDGHFYSSKPPLLSTLVAGLYGALHRATGLNLVDHPRTAIPAILIVVNWLPWVISLCVFARTTGRFLQSDFARVFLVLAMSCGTLLTPFLVTLNNHTVAAVSLMLAVAPVLPMLDGGRRDAWRFAVAGFFAAFTVCNEMPACLFGAAMFLVMFRVSPRGTFFWFVPAAVVPLALFLWNTHVVGGSLVPFQARYGSEIYRYVHEGVPSYWTNPGGIDQSRESPWVYFLHCTVGHHGWLSLSPMFLLVFSGWWKGLRGVAPWKTICRMSLPLTAWVFAFYLSRSENYNYGGNTSGLRWAFWLIPLWIWTLAPAIDQWSGRKAFRFFSLLLLFASVFSSTMPRGNPWRPPWLQVLMEGWGWVDYSTPPESFPKRKMWITSVPERDGAGIELAGMSPAGPVRWQVTLVRRAVVGGRTIAEVTARQEDGRESRTMRLLLDAEQVNQGAAAEDCLKHPGWGQAPWVDLAGPTAEMTVFLQGLPARGKASYVFRSTRYLKQPAVRTDAFRCRHMMISVDRRQNPTSPWQRFRRDVWSSDEVPFGAVQLEDTVSDPEGGTILFKQRLELVRIW